MKQSATLARLSKKTVAFLAAATTLLAGLSFATAAPQQANAATRDSYADTIGNPTFEAARQKYGLPKDMKDGATLHAFEWSFKTIMENIPDIAKAGYTSIQTEPIVKIKDNRKLGTGNWYLNWYYVYQPTDMSIGNYVVGSEDEFKEMCKLAHQYGLRIIVDSVSNHFTSDFDVIEGKWKNKAYYHEDKQISDYNNREDCTQHKLSGLWDLNTQDDTVTKGMHDLLVQTVADGADGFRYDAAKHIELSDEVFGGKQSHYWDTILQNGAQYQYGEVLEDANVREADYANLFNSSSPRGGGITDSSYGQEERNAVQNTLVACITAIDNVAKALGLGEPTGIELPEATGRRANPETKKELYDEGHDGWYDADTVAASIGQSENRFTPLQLCSYTAALANRGVRYTATLLKRVLSSDYQKLIRENQPVVASTLNISDEAYAAYSEGMREAVTSGTAYSAFVGYDVAVCAKTGTAQHGSGGSDNASFVLYAPADDPEIAIAVYVEKGAQGGTLGTIARDILTAYFSEAGSTDTVPAENSLI